MRRFSDEVRDLAAPLHDPGDFDVLLDRIGDARIVLLGGASHGTSEFCRWRAALTRRLVAERGFSFVAVEGDWPDCDRVDRSVRCREGYAEDPREALREFERWPAWMLANEEVADFCRWLREHNLSVDPEARVGFHGLDVYSLWGSMHEIVRHLREHDPERVPAAMRAYRCFEPFGEEPRAYSMSTNLVPEGCEDQIVELLTTLREHAAEMGAAEDAADEFSALQNAETVAGAERYYRALIGGGPEAWNIRETHMADTLDRLLHAYGAVLHSDAKAVVWAHNSHIGDARATDMAESGEVTLGQLVRDRHGGRRPEPGLRRPRPPIQHGAGGVVLVGMGTHRGTVLASPTWGGPVETMTLPPARGGSLEDEIHGAALDQALFVFPQTGRPDVLERWLAHRAIGVVYLPAREQLGNYAPTRLGDRYDAFCWFEETHAVHPLPVHHVELLEPETYPAGV